MSDGAARSPSFYEVLPDLWSLMKSHKRSLALGLFLMAVNRVSTFVVPTSTKYLVDDVVVRNKRSLLIPIVACVLLAALVRGLSSIAVAHIVSRSSQQAISDLRQRVQARICRLPLSFHDANKTGALSSRVMTDVEALRNLIGKNVIDVIGDVMSAVFALTILFRIQWTLTVFVCVVMALLAGGLRRTFGKTRPLIKLRSRLRSEMAGRLNESLSGIRVVKGYGAERREELVFAVGSQRLLDNTVSILLANSIAGFIVTALIGFATATVMFLGMKLVLDHVLLLGTYIMYTMYLAMLVAPVWEIVSVSPDILAAFAGLERTREILKERPECDDPNRSVSIVRVRGEIEFQNVYFSYDGERLVLEDANLTCRSETTTAIIGPSGAGKSTIAALIAAFYKPTRGRILIDGIDLSTILLDSYRCQLGLVMQDPFLFDGTLRDNVCFARPTSTTREILDACRVAHVDEFAEEFKDKYDTIIGERGVRLSGGQRQRISIARAILVDPRILILDEATSNVDYHSESLIQEGVSYLMRNRTCIVIAHRLRTIQSADQILVLAKGRITECGDHLSLQKRRGYYHEIYMRQFDGAYSSSGSTVSRPT